MSKLKLAMQGILNCAISTLELADIYDSFLVQHINKENCTITDSSSTGELN